MSSELDIISRWSVFDYFFSNRFVADNVGVQILAHTLTRSPSSILFTNMIPPRSVTFRCGRISCCTSSLPRSFSSAFGGTSLRTSSTTLSFLMPSLRCSGRSRGSLAQSSCSRCSSSTPLRWMMFGLRRTKSSGMYAYVLSLSLLLRPACLPAASLRSGGRHGASSAAVNYVLHVCLK